jgi:hypothetical protein
MVSQRVQKPSPVDILQSDYAEQSIVIPIQVEAAEKKMGINVRMSEHHWRSRFQSSK